MKLIGKNSFPPPRKILLIQLRRLGDTLLCTPAIRALAAQYPQAQIDFIVEDPGIEALYGHPQITRLVHAPKIGIGALIRFIKEVRKVKYDWAIDFMSNPRSAQFAYFSGAKTRVGFDRRGRRWAFTHRMVEEPADREAYAVDLRMEFLKLMGVKSAGRELDTWSDFAMPEEAARAHEAVKQCGGKPVIAVCAGNPNSAKRYPADLMAKVIEDLQREGFGIVVTAGPGEQEFAHMIQQHTESPVTLLLEATVPALAALYRKSVIYIGPDTGPKHVAVACRIPTVTIFGPGRPSNWNDPLSANNILIAAPCDTRPHCIESECAKRECLRKIKPQEIIRAAMSLLKA
jgi:ADP-heptose:LPS heptosyltransferase